MSPRLRLTALDLLSALKLLGMLDVDRNGHITGGGITAMAGHWGWSR